jgi:hypothetical protein
VCPRDRREGGGRALLLVVSTAAHVLGARCIAISGCTYLAGLLKDTPGTGHGHYHVVPMLTWQMLGAAYVYQEQVSLVADRALQLEV